VSTKEPKNSLLSKIVPQKRFKDISGLKLHPFFPQLKSDIESGEVFPAVGKGEMHFYYGGARLFVYKRKQMHTNIRYLGMTDEKIEADELPISNDEATDDLYRAIKANAKKWRDPKNAVGMKMQREKELRIVSELFTNFSIGKTTLPASCARLLDIECRFLNSTQKQKKNPEKNQKSDMIDCLFLLPKGTLVFVEVKHAENKDARGDGRRNPRVVSQLQSYNNQLKAKSQRDEVMSVYSYVAETIGGLLNQPAKKALSVYDRVPLLIVHKSIPLANSKERWQKDLLEQPIIFRADIIGIDGKNDFPAALKDFFIALEEQPSWEP
jgi:hypothetical protein